MFIMVIMVICTKDNWFFILSFDKLISQFQYTCSNTISDERNFPSALIKVISNRKHETFQEMCNKMIKGDDIIEVTVVDFK